VSEGESQLAYMTPVTLTTEFMLVAGVRDDRGDKVIRWQTATAVIGVAVVAAVVSYEK
jgi:hypothetical protein